MASSVEPVPGPPPPGQAAGADRRRRASANPPNPSATTIEHDEDDDHRGGQERAPGAAGAADGAPSGAPRPAGLDEGLLDDVVAIGVLLDRGRHDRQGVAELRQRVRVRQLPVGRTLVDDRIAGGGRRPRRPDHARGQRDAPAHTSRSPASSVSSTGKLMRNVWRQTPGDAASTGTRHDARTGSGATVDAFPRTVTLLSPACSVTRTPSPTSAGCAAPAAAAAAASPSSRRPAACGSSAPAVPPVHDNRVGPESMFTSASESHSPIRPRRPPRSPCSSASASTGSTSRWTGRSIAPDSGSPHKPAFDATDPAAYPAAGWTTFDAVVRDLKAAGIGIDLAIQPPPPRWAEGPGAPHPATQTEWRPNAKDFGQFVRAVATRYSGHYTPPGREQAPSPASPSGRYGTSRTSASIWRRRRSTTPRSRSRPALLSGVRRCGLERVRRHRPRPRHHPDRRARAGRDPLWRRARQLQLDAPAPVPPRALLRGQVLPAPCRARRRRSAGARRRPPAPASSRRRTIRGCSAPPAWPITRTHRACLPTRSRRGSRTTRSWRRLGNFERILDRLQHVYGSDDEVRRLGHRVRVSDHATGP